MINPTHRLKKFVKYSGNGKADDYHVIEVRGWLGSGVTDCNGVEIFEGDIIKDADGEIAQVYFVGSEFLVGDKELVEKLGLYDCNLIDKLKDKRGVEIIGHIATEEADNDSK